LPEDFQPKASHELMANEYGLPLPDVFAGFSDYHRSKGNKFKNWDLALNTWIRNEIRFSQNGGRKYDRRSKAQQRTEGNLAALAEAKRRLATRTANNFGGGDGRVVDAESIRDLFD
jgi:hypothetical protein